MWNCLSTLAEASISTQVTQSPIVVATDVRDMTETMTSLLLNGELLAMHQNTSTPPGASERRGYHHLAGRHHYHIHHTTHTTHS